ncbi:helix-turn-helix transcriptional regulator [Acinetobacter towneri]|uniref:helix-turn-helix transcriptional regulator n=1 Tax=Acinetobacter towneri TaxID=202956 RepID=UPI001443EB2B|nr:AlpA family phage regulatory protein [Acinetobacter towneri]
MLEMNTSQLTAIQANQPFALKFNDVAKKLGLSRTGLNFLIAKNPDFPRPFKLSDGEKAHNYFDYTEVLNWYEIQKNNRSSVSNQK